MISNSNEENTINNHSFIVINELYKNNVLMEYRILNGFSSKDKAEEYVNKMEQLLEESDKLVRIADERSDNKQMLEYHKSISSKRRIINVIIE